MMEVIRPQSANRSAVSGTVAITNPLPVNTGMEVVVVAGMNAPMAISAMAVPVVNVINTRLETLPPMNAPIVRPMSIRNQYVPATMPATAAVPRGSLKGLPSFFACSLAASTAFFALSAASRSAV